MTLIVGILGTGDMGHAVGATLRAGGARVVTCLAGRSARSRTLAADAGFDDLPTMDDLVREADLFLSIIAPAAASELGERVAASLRATGAQIVFAECNAIAPHTVRAIGQIITAAGGTFVDAGIVGGPPKPGQSDTRFYASGPSIGAFASLAEYGLQVRIIGSEIGQASGLKMCYAALTKGLTALGTELLAAAHLMGLGDALRAEQEASTPDLLHSLMRSVPTMPAKSRRWVGEMEEIAATFDDLGLTPRMLLGAADIYRLVGETPLADETPQTRDPTRTLDAVIGIIAAQAARK